MAYRQFKLINSLGQVYTLTDQNFKVFLNNPTGLGMRKNISGIRVGNRYKINKREYDLPRPGGELVFYDDINEDKYSKYIEFVQFASHYPLKLYYYVPNNDISEQDSNAIYLNCEVQILNKDEVKTDSLLRVPVTFLATTFWLAAKESRIYINEQDVGDGQFTFPLSFPFSFGSDPLRNIKFPNNGTLVTPLTYELNGLCINPYIRLYDENFVEYGAARFIGNFDYIYVNSNDNEEQIILKYNGSELSNPANYQDLTIGNVDEEDDYFLTFLKVKPGISYASVTFGNNFEGSIELKWRDEYATF